MALSPTLTAFLRQIRGDASGGVTGLLTDIPTFNTAIEELAAGGGTAVDFQEEGASVVLSDIANFAGAGVTVTESPAGTALITIPGGGGGGGGVINVAHELPNGTQGGTTSASVWNVRDLNIVKKNTIVGASLAAKQITLPAGDYYARGSQQSFGGNEIQSRLRDVTNGVTVAFGQSSNHGTGGVNAMPFEGYFTLAGTADLELQLWALNGIATGGFGIKASSGEVETYAQINIEEV